MVNIKYIVKRLVFYLSLLIIIIAVADFLVFSGKEVSFSSDNAYYSFDPNSVLVAHSRGNIGSFIQVDEMPDVPNLPYVGSVYWSASDFWYVAQDFHKFHWKESLDNWKLYYLRYDFDCNDIEKGPFFSWFSLYKFAWQNNQLIRIKEDIQINLLVNNISWIEAESSPASYWRSVNPTEIGISVTEALKIAENSGGKEARLQVNNSQCTISVVLAPNGMAKGWWVDYSVLGSQVRYSFLTFDINLRNGNHQIIYPTNK